MSKITGKININDKLEGKLDSHAELDGDIGIPQKIANNDYENLANLPQIEGITLTGNKTFEDLKLHVLTNSEIEALLTL